MYKYFVEVAMNKIKCRVIGNSPQNFINALYNRNITIYNLQIKDKEMVFSIEYKYFDSVQKLFSQINYKIEVISAPKFSTFKGFLKSSVGVLLAFAIVVIGLSYYSARIWQYRIYGLNNIKNEEIVQVLNKIGAKKGTTKSTVDLNALSVALMRNIDNIALCSANFVGTTLVITISEKIDNSALLGEYAPIVAQCSCIITKIITTAGTALVNVGDKVAKGQTIIANYIVDSNGARIPSKARGEISFDAYYTFSKTYYTNITKLERTGKIQKFVSVESRQKDACKFTKYEVETKTYYLSKIIPMKIIETIYYELNEIQYPIDIEKDVQKLVEITKNEAKNIHNIKDFKEEIVNIVPTQDGGKQISVTYKVNENMVF